MKKNIGNLDKLIRAIFSIGLICLGTFYFKGPYGYVLASTGVFILLTVVLGFCPFYKLCEISTKKTIKKD